MKRRRRCDICRQNRLTTIRRDEGLFAGLTVCGLCQVDSMRDEDYAVYLQEHIDSNGQIILDSVLSPDAFYSVKCEHERMAKAERGAECGQ